MANGIRGRGKGSDWRVERRSERWLVIGPPLGESGRWTVYDMKTRSAMPSEFRMRNTAIDWCDMASGLAQANGHGHIVVTSLQRGVAGLYPRTFLFSGTQEAYDKVWELEGSPEHQNVRIHVDAA